MEQIKYFCDHCGKELNSSTDYTDVGLDLYTKEIRADLCEHCFDGLTNYIETFCKGQKDEIL